MPRGQQLARDGAETKITSPTARTKMAMLAARYPFPRTCRPANNYRFWPATRGTMFRLLMAVLLVTVGCQPSTWPWTVPGQHPTSGTPPVSLASAQMQQPPGNAYVQELSQRLQAAGDEIRSLEARLAYREEKIEEKSRELSQALKEIQAAQTELSQARQEIEQLRQENANLQARLQASERQNREHLQTIAVLLQRLMERGQPSPALPPGH
jgi:hypothetical protein